MCNDLNVLLRVYNMTCLIMRQRRIFGFFVMFESIIPRDSYKYSNSK